MGPKFLLRERSRDLRHKYTQRKGGHGKTEAETVVMLAQTKECLSHQKLEAARQNSPLEPLERAGPTRFQILDSKMVKINFYCLKPPSLCQFVMVATGN